MRENIIKIGETYYNLDNIISFKVWRKYIELIYPDNIFIRVEEESDKEKVRKYYGIKESVNE